MKKILMLCCIILFAFVICCHNSSSVYAQSIHWQTVRDLNEWNIGRPYEAIPFGLNVTDSPKDVANVTLYYSINEKIDEKTVTKF